MDGFIATSLTKKLSIDLVGSIGTMEEVQTMKIVSGCYYKFSRSNGSNALVFSFPMAELELVVFVLLSILGRLNPSYGANEDRCAPKACQQGQPSIRFPYILNNMQNMSCAYPGFELSCNANGNTVINLPFAGVFLVDFIHYRQQNIWLKDPSDCLPLRLKNFDTTGSTLTVAGYREFTFWNCSGNSDRMLPGLTRVGCLSGKGYDIMVLPSNELSGTDPKDVEGCEDTWKVQVPSVPKDWSSSRTIETIGLKWEFPRCENCEEQHGTCALKSEKSKEVTCSYPDGTPSTLKAYVLEN
ncbi:hypothetical protein MLD38_023743 [Melastoma candidum]|uniref:Uncharacterized protein n=1 Tax=Melastoma candidum TaxID=119954 RepID=A0ACB9NT13_9MYRT|nr:hypothetical protein MLD38_023743 [Melastoma candidum]